ncbi:glycine--tRNA ligase subunit beta [Desulfococcaceae bacterium OttesenSCG-928-F15]|nr:glycine--tRNA ligase subunit beta [Desulfococcaceae bacterium OttesenSCG-928-F15]
MLFEIGTEEIPASYIEPALQGLTAFIGKKLSEERVDFGEIRTFATPRRLALLVDGLPENQRPETKELMGPPEKAAFGADGKPGVPALKFAEKAGIPFSQVEIRETPKGRYLFARVEEKVRPTREVLAELLPQAVSAIPFPKTMRWASTDLSFARPIQGFLALLGEEIISFELEGLVSGRVTRGHRFHHPAPLAIDIPENYEKILQDAGVIADIAKRRQAVFSSVGEVAKNCGGRVIEDAALLDTVTELVEAPYPVLGSFDESFLEIPREVLITSMREHQKYFALEDEKGNLLPLFVAVNNTSPKDMNLVRDGHQRVLRARLSDARFFWETDQKAGFDHWNEKLSQVLFQAKLGTVFEKVERIRILAARMGNALSFPQDAVKDLDRAALLCKADLACQMVYEFPEVQGIMGRAYALLQGENRRVAEAIEDHYKPLASGAELPRDEIGAVLAISDKLDTLCGCFSVGLRPTGAADPFALRRATLGILQILKTREISLSLKDMISWALDILGDKKSEDAEETAIAVLDFMQTRLVNLFVEEGFSRESLGAVLAVRPGNVPEIRKRALALDAMKNHPDFQALAGAFKRAANLLKKAGEVVPETKPELFTEEVEKALYTAFMECKAQVQALMEKGNLEEALLAIAGLRGPVDAYFDKVMVMEKDLAIRANRLGLLAMIAGLFSMIADFSKI